MRLKFKKDKIGNVLIILICLATAYYGVFYVFHFVMAIGNSPQIQDKTKNDLTKLSSETLIAMLNIRYIDPFYDPYLILNILAERKEKKAVPAILKLLNSKKSFYRQEAMYALAKIKDDRAIEPLTKIVNRKQKDRDYLLALDTLSKMHYDGAYPLILEMKNNGMHYSYIIDMIKNYPDRPETLPTLIEISKSTRENYVRDKANEAIEYINKSIK
ncbi:MAG: HEAT repeat domain-containing protein [Candidatus Omnitrophota bacterium]